MDNQQPCCCWRCASHEEIADVPLLMLVFGGGVTKRGSEVPEIRPLTFNFPHHECPPELLTSTPQQKKAGWQQVNFIDQSFPRNPTYFPHGFLENQPILLHNSTTPGRFDKHVWSPVFNWQQINMFSYQKTIMIVRWFQLQPEKQNKNTSLSVIFARASRKGLHDTFDILI